MDDERCSVRKRNFARDYEIAQKISLHMENLFPVHYSHRPMPVSHKIISPVRDGFVSLYLEREEHKVN